MPLTGESQGTHAEPVELSVVIPVFNEADNLDRLLARLKPVLAALNTTYEIVFVDDGSSDATRARLVDKQRLDASLVVIGLSRNFGKEAALSAGLAHARGDAVVLLDADLQDPPELIQQLVARWREGYEVAYALRLSRSGETWIKRFTASAFYRAFNLVSKHPIPADTGDYRLLDRRVVDVLNRLPERTRFMKGLFSWVGFRQVAVPFEREPRHRGQSKFNYWKLWNFALEGIVSFSSLPVRLPLYAGLLMAALAVIAAPTLGILAALGVNVPSSLWLAVGGVFLSGLHLAVLGMLGEYVCRLSEEVRGRPLYIVSERHGLAAPDAREPLLLPFSPSTHAALPVPRRAQSA
jgi:glycosyltransferase involved in cell wall biosynthesis